MSDTLSAVRSAFRTVVSAVQDLSARSPGSATSQALVFGILVAFLVHRIGKRRYRLPPGPLAWPLLGNLWSLGSTEDPPYIQFWKWSAEYGSVVTVYLGPMRCVTLNNIDVITEALVEKGADFAGRPLAYSTGVFKEGHQDIVFGDYSPAWKLHRKIALQALRHYLRGSHLERAVHEVVAMVSQQLEAEPGAFDLHPYTSTLVFHLIDSICFGKTKPFGDPSLKRIASDSDKFLKDSGSGYLEDFIPLLRYCPTRKFRTASSIQQLFLTYIYENVDEHRKKFSPEHTRDLTDSILLAQSEAEREESSEVMAMFSNTRVAQTIGNVFSAGADTTIATLDWAVFLLAGHPLIQKRLQEELDSVTGTRLPGTEDRPRLQYTEAVLYEVMRLGTAVPLSVPHKTICDTTVGGYDVPKGTTVLINQWAVMHDPEKWDQPEEFKPERFLDEQGNLNSKSDCWIPFGLGRRICLAETVARPELLLLLACLLKRFTFSLPPGVTCRLEYELVGVIMNFPPPFTVLATPRSIH